MRTAWLVRLADKQVLRVQHEDEGMLVARKIGKVWVRARVRMRDHKTEWCPVKKTLSGYTEDGVYSDLYFALLKHLDVDLKTGSEAML